MRVKASFTSQLDKLFNLYLKELIEWNKKFNLTAVTDPDEIRIRHFEDSLSVLQAIDLKDQKVLDVGAGAGFPGIPLKIVRPNIKLTLIDSTRKKVEFLNHIIKLLKLDHAEAIWGRAEVLGSDPKYKGKFDVVVSRAVAKLPLLIKYCLPFLRPGGVFVAMKQENVEEETKQARNNLKKLKGKIKDLIKIKAGDIPRSLIVIGKI
jgi:16S rRNA (guanine527-N7)-methyltransferase